MAQICYQRQRIIMHRDTMRYVIVNGGARAVPAVMFDVVFDVVSDVMPTTTR